MHNRFSLLEIPVTFWSGSGTVCVHTVEEWDSRLQGPQDISTTRPMLMHRVSRSMGLNEKQRNARISETRVP